MGGFVTWIGVAQLLASIILRALGHHDVADVVTGTGGATAAVGIGRKIEKHKK